MNTKISVIITTYKRPKQLGRAIKSVITQTFMDWELLVVDDNNSDSEYRIETEKFMKQYSGDKRIKYIKHEKNTGAPEARNTGIKNALSEYIAFLDDDDEFLPEKLERQLSIFESSEIENIGVVYCKNKYLDEKGKVIRYSVAQVRGNVLKYQLLRSLAITSTLMIKKSALLKIGGFKNIICGQECDLLLRIFANGYNADFVDDYLTLVYVHNGERITTGEKVIQGRIYIFKERQKYFYLLSSKEQKIAEWHHYISVFRDYIILGNKSFAFACFKKMIKCRPFYFLTYFEGLIFIFPITLVNKLKRYLHYMRKIMKGER